MIRRLCLTQLSEYYTELGKNEDGESDSVTYAKLELEKEQLKESTKMSENIERELENKGISSSVEVQIGRASCRERV